VIYADTGSEHPDNARFLKDCEEKLFHKKVTIIKNKEFKNVFEVFEKRRYLAGIQGAPCTTEMKKLPIREYLGDRLYDSPQVFGYDWGEQKRVERFEKNNPEITLYLPLIDRCLTKSNCLALLQQFGIKLPAMYELGYSNSNCLGCPKAANLKYWSAIRQDFPDIFNWYAEFERKIGAKGEDGKPKGAAINKRYINKVRTRLFLDELPADIEPNRSVDISCGYSCGQVVDIIEGKKEYPSSSSDVSGVFSWLSS